jgi:hypothetical protein
MVAMSLSNRYALETLARQRQAEIEKQLCQASLLRKPSARSSLPRIKPQWALGAASLIMAGLITAATLAYLHWTAMVGVAMSVADILGA